MNDPNDVYSDWRDEALCANTDMNPDDFQMLKGESHQTPRVRMIARICMNACPVQEQCLEYGLSVNDPNSIYGGYTPRQIKEIRATLNK